MIKRNVWVFLGISLISCFEIWSCLKDKVEPAHASQNLKKINPDHIIFCWFENKAYDTIIDNPKARYINSLRLRGVSFSNMHALDHPSYPEYIRFFAGTNNNVLSDNCIDSSNWNIPNLYTVLKSVGKTFAWYSEDLPATGSTVCASKNYREKHNPVTLFANVPSSQNKRYEDFPSDFSKLENVVCITPNLVHDMHDGSIEQGDEWLRENCSSLIEWCKTHNSVFVIYFDEDEGSKQNRIPVIALGQSVKENFTDNSNYDHYNWTHTICSLFGAPVNWAPNVQSHSEINDCWK